MRLFLVFGLLVGVHAQTTKKYADTFAPDATSFPSEARTSAPTVSTGPSVSPSSSSPPSLSAAPSGLPTLSSVPSIAASTPPSGSPSISSEPSVSAVPSSEPSVSLKPSVSFSPSDSPSQLADHKGIEIRYEVQTPHTPLRKKELPAFDLKIWDGDCQVFKNKVTADNTDLPVKYLLLDSKTNKKDVSWLNMPTDELNGKHEVTAMIDVTKATITNSNSFQYTNDDKSEGELKICIRSYLSVDSIHGNDKEEGFGKIGDEGWETVDFDEIEATLRINLLKSFQDALTFQTDRADIENFGDDFELDDVEIDAFECDISGERLTTAKKYEQSDEVNICLEVNKANVYIEDVKKMELSATSVTGTYKPIDNYATKLTTQKTYITTDKKKIRVNTLLPLVFFRYTNAAVAVNGEVKLGLGEPTAVGRRVLETREVRKLQEAGPSEGIGSFSLDILLADDATVDANAGTSAEDSSQTDIDVEDAEDISAATHSVFTLALLVAGIALFNILL